MTSIALVALNSYAGGTEVSPVVAPVVSTPGPAGEAFSETNNHRWQHQAACATTSPECNAWTPAAEAPSVPIELYNICRSCPVRSRCLNTAVIDDEAGYWAGTTTSDRQVLAATGISIVAADALRHSRMQQAKHVSGAGNTYWYNKRGCRCGECTAANTAVQARKRAFRNQLADERPQP